MKKILVVDDNRAIREALEFALEGEGYEVVTTGHFEQGMVNESFNLIILDMLLSGHNGTEICKELKTIPELKDIPVLMISAHPNAEEEVKACGANGFISKPFELNDLLTTVKGHLA